MNQLFGVGFEIASINPVDLKTAECQQAVIGEGKWPIVFGRDLVGTILLSEADGWSAGDRVGTILGQNRGA